MAHYEQIQLLRDYPERAPWAGRMPVFKAGEIIGARRVEFPTRGWVARRSTTDSIEWLLEEGVDAVRVDEDDGTRADVGLAHGIGLEF